jgi:hypothetical protein
MPEISRFYGIRIKMYFGDHAPPHFHAEYGDDSAVFDIETLSVTEGRLPPRASGLVVEWGTQHRDELAALWDLAAAFQPLHRIAPLD